MTLGITDRMTAELSRDRPALVSAAADRVAEPFLTRNRVIAEAVGRGDGDAAEAELLSYLDDAERQLLDLYRAGPPAGGPDQVR